MEYSIARKVFSNSSDVQGWFAKEAAMLIAIVDEFQKNHDISGDIFEIGVHHGKSSLFFSHLLRKSENLHICDIFGSDDNVSHSGAGNEQIFRENMSKYGAKDVAKYHKCLSSKLSTKDIGRDYRMFHIDGGHNPDEALGDLILASHTLHPRGVIILDDPFRVEWPGVTEALIKFLQINPDFRASVVGFNKILVMRKEVADEYRSFIASIDLQRRYRLAFPFETKRLPFAGSELYIFFISTRYVTLKSWKVWFRKAFFSGASTTG